MLSILLFRVVAAVASEHLPQHSASVPSLLLYNGTAVALVRQRVSMNTSAFGQAMQQLRSDCEHIMSQHGTWSVMTKTATAASGDKHDYYT